ncbi:hypothetical protein J6590_039950 [Homalodisca vitripennis]|nr:hypothetical protein J6590_039950 [Homalodisca vitripennis]
MHIRNCREDSPTTTVGGGAHSKQLAVGLVTIVSELCRVTHTSAVPYENHELVICTAKTCENISNNEGQHCAERIQSFNLCHCHVQVRVNRQDYIMYVHGLRDNVRYTKAVFASLCLHGWQEEK